MRFVLVFILGSQIAGCSRTNSDAPKPSYHSEAVSQAALRRASLQSLMASANPNKPLVFSHRGDPYDAPEHSFAGYDEAIKQGSAFIEQDVWLSKDGKLFVSHDDNLRRTTGQNVNITTTPASQLQSLRLRNGEHLHTLASVFKRYRSKVHYLVEAKNNSLSNDITTQKALLENLRRFNMGSNVIVQDTNSQGLAYIHTHEGKQKIATLWLMPGDTVDQRRANIETAPRWLNFISIDLLTATRDDIVNIKARHFLSNVWTISEYSDIQTVKDLHVDSVFTNETRRTLSMLD